MKKRYCGKCFFIDPKDNPPVCGEGCEITVTKHGILRPKDCPLKDKNEYLKELLRKETKPSHIRTKK